MTRLLSSEQEQLESHGRVDRHPDEWSVTVDGNVIKFAENGNQLFNGAANLTVHFNP